MGRNKGGSIDLERSVMGIGGHWFWQAPSIDSRFLIGFDLDAQRDLRKRYANNQGILGDLTTMQDEDVDSHSLYFEDVWRFSQQWALTVGARLDEMTYKVTDRTESQGSGMSDFSELSSMVGLTRTFGDQLNFYGNISTAFDPPTLIEL